MEIKHCLRCEKDWCFRGKGRPLRCGKCKSPYWDKERINEVSENHGSRSRSEKISRPAVKSERNVPEVGRVELAKLPQGVRVASSFESGPDAGAGGDAETVNLRVVGRECVGEGRRKASLAVVIPQSAEAPRSLPRANREFESPPDPTSIPVAISAWKCKCGCGLK